MAINHNILRQLGMNEKEARVYLAALEYGPISLIKLAQKSGVKRTTIYEFADDMVARGLLVTTVSGKRKLYQGTRPEELERLLEKQKETLGQIMPELLLLAEKSPTKPKIRLYEGVEGLKMVFDDTLNQPDGSEVLFIATWAGTFDILPESFVSKYIERRKKKKIRVRSIVPHDEDAVRGKESDKEDLRETLIVPREDLPIKSKINIYQNKLAILSFGDEKISIIIESPQIADTQRAIFNLLWKSLKRSQK